MNAGSTEDIRAESSHQAKRIFETSNHTLSSFYCFTFNLVANRHGPTGGRMLFSMSCLAGLEQTAVTKVGEATLNAGFLLQFLNFPSPSSLGRLLFLAAQLWPRCSLEHPGERVTSCGQCTNCRFRKWSGFLKDLIFEYSQ